MSLSDYGIKGRQTDIRKADLERGVWIVVVPEKDSEWVAHVWREGQEILGTQKEAEDLCGFLKDKGHDARVVRVAPEASLFREYNELWVSVLHDNDLIDMKDADGANKKFVLDLLKERLAQKR